MISHMLIDIDMRLWPRVEYQIEDGDHRYIKDNIYNESCMYIMLIFLGKQMWSMKIEGWTIII